MGPALDLREYPDEESRQTLFDELAAVDVGESVAVVADRDVDTDLVRYQIEHDRRLEWTYADPDAEPRELEVTRGEPLEGDRGAVDVRDLKPQRRHEALLSIFDELDPGGGFVLVNDHDPKPLYHELTSMHGDVVEWEYRDRGADAWRVEIAKTGVSEGDTGDVVTRYDIREIPKAERHPTIHHRYGMIPEGGTMELVAPHEPRPLHREFRERYGDAFDWEVVESEPGRCRVHITKADDAGDRDAGASDAGDQAAGAHDAGGCGAAGAAQATDAESDSVTVGDDLEVVEVLDVRDRPPAQRHEAIFDAYADLAGGEGFVLVNDHDPKPLYHQFEAEAGPQFRWEYRQKEPGEFRVLIGKADAAEQDHGHGHGHSHDHSHGHDHGGADHGAADETPDAPF
ncbi:DUF2249 domain-containing protein [Halosimplex halobium]|uniref:DUF2249 domain-containing protein n=1 Tax=Halosimplex halobium TaxID=3396618 RepID=UPI003F565DBF